MKRFSVGLLIGLLVGLLTITAPVFANQEIQLYVNGKKIQSEAPPQLINGRIMVPVRFVAESLGANVDWYASANLINITSKNITQGGKELTPDEWRSQVKDTINNKLSKILTDNTLSRTDKATKIAFLIRDNLSYTLPDSLKFEHYYLIQYLFARQNMQMSLEIAESQKNDPIGFSQSTAIFNFNRGIATSCIKELENYLE